MNSGMPSGPVNTTYTHLAVRAGKWLRKIEVLGSLNPPKPQKSRFWVFKSLISYSIRDL